MESPNFRYRLIILGTASASIILVLAAIMNYSVVVEFLDSSITFTQSDRDISHSIVAEKFLLSKGYTKNDIAAIKGIMTNLLEERSADLVAFGVYVYDPNAQQTYIVFPIQVSVPGVYPIPDAKYWLVQNKLYVRYLTHKKGECFQRYFEQTNTISLSCPLIVDEEVIGFLSFDIIKERLEEEGYPSNRDYVIDAVNDIKIRHL